jgi:regulator of PEP synthase PpsR (kinase-PPPase family)
MTKHNIMIIGLIKEARRLSQIRQNRLESMKDSANEDYADIRKINEELTQARRLYQDQGWPIIDVSRKSIEETAAEIIKIYQKWRENNDHG